MVNGDIFDGLVFLPEISLNNNRSIYSTVYISNSSLFEHLNKNMFKAALKYNFSHFLTLPNPTVFVIWACWKNTAGEDGESDVLLFESFLVSLICPYIFQK